jgi:hypothetical protein
MVIAGMFSILIIWTLPRANSLHGLSFSKNMKKNEELRGQIKS